MGLILKPTHKRRGSEVQPLSTKKQRQTLPEEGQSQQETVTVESVPVNVFMSLPLVHVLPEMQIFYPSTIVNQLKCMGIEPLATELARKNLPLAGKIRHFLPNWVKLTQNPWVLEAVQGFRVPFTQQPFQKQPPKPLRHSEAEENLLQEEIQSMITKNAIEETTPKGHGFLSTVFLVPKKDEGQRPVINLKSVNRFVHTEHFKMEGIHILKDLLRAGDWMTKVDLKDAYYMVPIYTRRTEPS